VHGMQSLASRFIFLLLKSSGGLMQFSLFFAM
jgi:hypothetical protein